jgi:hypothetical protein
VAERQGYDLMPEQGYRPTNKYLPPRPRKNSCDAGSRAPARLEPVSDGSIGNALLRWVDRVLSR